MSENLQAEEEDEIKVERDLAEYGALKYVIYIINYIYFIYAHRQAFLAFSIINRTM